MHLSILKGLEAYPRSHTAPMTVMRILQDANAWGVPVLPAFPTLERQVGELFEGHPLQVGMRKWIRLPLLFPARPVLRLQ